MRYEKSALKNVEAQVPCGFRMRAKSGCRMATSRTRRILRILYYGSAKNGASALFDYSFQATICAEKSHLAASTLLMPNLLTWDHGAAYSTSAAALGRL